MQVETYEVQEATSNHPEVTAEVSSLIDELGLVGQLDVASPKTGAPVPYRLVLDTEQSVLDVLCPRHTNVESCKDGPIPLRVLECLRYAKSLDYFDKFEVWHPEPGVDDPALIGVKMVENHGWKQPTNYLLARWGEVVKPFAELAKEAGAQWHGAMLAKLEKMRVKIQGDIEALEAVAPEASLPIRSNSGPYYQSCID